MTDGLHIDFETRSRLELRDVGVYRYAEHESTGIWGFAYQLDGPVRQWIFGEPFPDEVQKHVANGGTVIAHNAQFERIIWNTVLLRNYSFLSELSIEQMNCTLVRALAVNLPAELHMLSVVLNLRNRKDHEGSKLMQQMARPRLRRDGVITWWDDKEHVDRLMQYCCQDVRVETEADNMLPQLTPEETKLWHLDQLINDRGVPVDIDMVNRANDLVEYARNKANDLISYWTEGAVRSVGQRDATLRWLNKRGIVASTLRKGDYEWIVVQSDINNDATARNVIELRRVAAKTSTAKYVATATAMCDDGRLHGLLQFNGAAQTGRWAGRLTQPQNYPRVDDDTEAEVVEWIVGLLKSEMPKEEVFELIELIGPPKLANGDPQDGMSTLAWLAKSLRSTIATGNKFYGGDFSNIEGRINAWLASETWKLQAFEAYDAGMGPDLYKLAFARGFNLPVEDITRPQRQIGKVMELACGYQGGVGAFLTLSQTYLLKVHELVRSIEATANPADLERLSLKYEYARDKWGLNERNWTAVKLVVNNWRQAHPAITESWWELQDAAIQAVDQVGTFVSVYNGRSHYQSDGNYLYCFLPSGRVICYPQAHISVEVVEQIYNGVQWIDVEELPLAELDQLLQAGYKIVTRKKRGVRFFGLNERRQWVRQALYGGHQAENIVQATARDALTYAMLKTEAAGYPLILTVHDELLSELEAQFGSAPHYTQLMSERPPWAGGLPVIAKAWEGKRYNK